MNHWHRHILELTKISRNERSQVCSQQSIQTGEPLHEHPLACERSGRATSITSRPPNHTHTGMAAAPAPDPNVSGHIQRRDFASILVTWEWSHSELGTSSFQEAWKEGSFDWSL